MYVKTNMEIQPTAMAVACEQKLQNLKRCNLEQENANSHRWIRGREEGSRYEMKLWVWRGSWPNENLMTTGNTYIQTSGEIYYKITQKRGLRARRNCASCSTHREIWNILHWWLQGLCWLFRTLWRLMHLQLRQENLRKRLELNKWHAWAEN